MARTRIKFWGVRGSIAAPGKKTAHFGGNTTCFEIEHGPTRIICDAGTGIRGLGQDLERRSRKKPIEALILMSHLHWDHYIGLPFFAPIYNDRNRFTIAGPRIMGMDFPSVIRDAIRPPYFPISTAEFKAKVEFINFGLNEYEFGNVKIVPHEAHHPQGACGWRFNFPGGKSAVIMTDNEPRGAADELALLEFIKNTDVLIHDAQYTPRTYATRLGWGHSPYTYAVKLAAAARVRRLFLAHFDPEDDDAALKKVLLNAKSFAKRVHCKAIVAMAREGAAIDL